MTGTNAGLFATQPAGYSAFNALTQRFSLTLNATLTDCFVFIQKKLRAPLPLFSLQSASHVGTVTVMKLTILRLQCLSTQDLLDLRKIWPDSDPTELETRLDEQHRLYAAKFNDRLLAAVNVTLKETRGELADFMVREVTRRRGVGSYLLEEVLAQNAAVTCWWMAKNGNEALSAFMPEQGFIALGDGWVWQRP